MYFIIPDWVVAILAVLVWGLFIFLFWFKPRVWPKIDEYFYIRRARRKMRNYAIADVKSTAHLFDVNSIHPNNIYQTTYPKKVTKRARARHRR